LRGASGKSALQSIAIFERPSAKPVQNGDATFIAAFTMMAALRKMRRTAMKAIFVAATAALMLSTAAASAAEPGSWSAHWTGPHGGVYEGSGKCADGVCQSSGTFTGPYGGVWHHTGNAHQTAPGQWTGEGQLTTPAGGTLQHSWIWHRNGT
jgi:hypothetical protein